MIFKSKKNNKGETLVEVLIAIAVIAVVLGSSYAIASRSLNQGVQARERTEALKIIQSQIEILKLEALRVGTPAENVDFNSNYRTDGYCLVAPNNADAVGSAARVNPGPNKTDPQTYHSDCIRNAQNQPDPGGRYKLNMVFTPDSGGTNSGTFEVWARWDRIGGGPQESTRIYYRL